MENTFSTATIPQGNTAVPHATQTATATLSGTPPTVAPATAPTAIPQLVPEELRPQPEQVILEWQSPSRPFKKKNRQYYVTIALFVFLIALIAVALNQFLFVGVVLSFGFLSYVLSAVPPKNTLHQVTTYGIRSDEQLYPWPELGRFWFDQRYHQPLIHVELHRFPNRITLLLGEISQETLRGILGQVLLYERPVPTAFEQAAAWLQQKIPLETDEPNT